MVNIYDNANQMAKDLQETEQFKDLKKSLENLKNKPESLDLYQRMDKLQQQILAAQNSGQPLSDDVKKEYPEIKTNYEEAKAAAKKLNSSMKIVPVKTVQEALDYL